VKRDAAQAFGVTTTYCRRKYEKNGVRIYEMNRASNSANSYINIFIVIFARFGATVRFSAPLQGFLTI